MSIFNFVCPVCENLLETESNVKTMYCPYCEQRIDVQKEIEIQKIEIENDKLSYYSKIEKYKDEGDEAFQNKDYQSAIESYLEALKLDKSNVYVAESIVKAANYAIDDHYEELESLYIENPRAISISGVDEDLDYFLQMRKFALEFLDPRTILPEMKVTPHESKVVLAIKKKRRQYFTIRIISVIGAIAFLVAVIVLLAIRP